MACHGFDRCFKERFSQSATAANLPSIGLEEKFARILHRQTVGRVEVASFTTSSCCMNGLSEALQVSPSYVNRDHVQKNISTLRNLTFAPILGCVAAAAPRARAWKSRIQTLTAWSEESKLSRLTSITPQNRKIDVIVLPFSVHTGSSPSVAVSWCQTRNTPDCPENYWMPALAQCNDLDSIPDRELDDFLFSATWNGCFNWIQLNSD